MAERVHARSLSVSRRLERVSTGTWLVLLVVGGLLAALVVGLLFTGSPAKVSTQLTALPAGSDRAHFLVRYRITKPSHTEVRCTLTATDERHEVVGSFTDTIPARADAQRTTSRSVTIPTTGLAVSSDVTGCSITSRG